MGTGGFSVVSEIIALDLDDVYDTSEQESTLRKDFYKQYRSNDSKYVLKMLRSDLPVEEHVKGVTDLAIEANFLRILDHPHIISMRAVANTDPRENRFFVVLDRLVLTLDSKFNYWRKLVGENSGYWVPFYGYCCARSPALHAIWKDRLGVARDIAKAVQFLHFNRIVYRDLKPDNIGFDINQQLKIFDFGLAKSLLDVQRDAGTGLYLLTGNTGSLRYMAPEVASDRPYDQSCDAYSFGILFWQLCSLQTPFAGYSQKLHAEKVVQQGHRPRPDRTWPDSWVDLMNSSWNQDYQLRPSFDYITGLLEEKIHEMEQEDGVVPSKASEIRAKKRKKKPQPVDESLSVDTRLSTEAEKGIKRVDADIV